MYPFPEGSIRLGPCTHPRDGEHGSAIRLASGVEVFAAAGAVRSLPRNWRDKQPDPPSPEARVLDASMG